LRPRARRAPVFVAILAAHALALLGLVTLHHRHAREHTPEPIELSLVAAPPREVKPATVPPPPSLQSPPPPSVLPMPLITIETAAAPVMTAAPPPARPVEAPAREAAPPAAAPPTERAPEARTIPASAVQYLVPPAPVYSRQSARLKESGRVVVRVFVDEDGTARDVQLAKSSGYTRLDDSALTAVRNARFKPYTENGRPVSGWVFIPIEFELAS
jgi:protein TonB